MSDSYKYIKLFLIVIFAGAIVAIGAKEINQRNARRGPLDLNKDPRELIRTLQGEVDLEKASLSRKALLEEQAKNANSSSSSDSDDPNQKTPLTQAIDRIAP